LLHHNKKLLLELQILQSRAVEENKLKSNLEKIPFHQKEKILQVLFQDLLNQADLLEQSREQNQKK